MEKDIEDIEKNLALLLEDDVQKHVTHRINNGWCVVIGNSQLIEILENEVYTPKTKANSDCELILGGFPITALFLVKKTNRLKEFLHNPDKFDEIIGLDFKGYDGKMLHVECIGKVKKDAHIEFVMPSSEGFEGQAVGSQKAEKPRDEGS